MECPDCVTKARLEENMACPSTGLNSPGPDGEENYQLIFNGSRVSKQEMAEICSLIDRGGRISTIKY